MRHASKQSGTPPSAAVTEAKRLKKALQESETNFRTFFESMADMVFVVGLDGRLLLTNAAVSARLGYSAEELGELSVVELHPAAHREEARTIFAAMLAGEREVCPLPLLAKDGTMVPVETKVWYGNWGGDRCVFGLAKDLTAEQEGLQRFERLFRSNPSILALSSLPDDRFADVNDCFLERLGYARDEVVGKTTDEVGLFFDPEERATVGRALQLQGRVGGFELRLRHRNGSVLNCLLSAELVSNQGRQYLLIVMVDITECRDLEERLRQSEKMEAIGQLAGGVAHDFNNMLEVIIGYTELTLDDQALAPSLHADLQEVLKAARRSADLTRQLLTFARKQVISPRVLDLNETVEGMLNMLRRLIGENIDLDWQPKEGLWSVRMDPLQIDQILANLCVNARDAIGDIGAVKIALRNVILDEATCINHAAPAPGEYVLLSVSDNGCGMDQKTVAQVFEPFFTTKEIGKGTGLGLAAVYGIVQQNAGGANIRSEPGLGTTFEIYLPRHVGAASVMTNGEGPAQRGTETVLLVEDEVAILKIVKRMLEGQGYTVLAAETPGEAVRLAREYAGEIRLLIADVIMPEMNGRDLAKNVLAIRPGIKRLFMSGYTADVIAHHGVLDEGVHFIQKPFARKALADKVREVLDHE